MAFIDFEKDRKTIAAAPRWMRWTLGAVVLLIIGILLLPEAPPAPGRPTEREQATATESPPAQPTFAPAAIEAAKAAITAEPAVKDMHYDPAAAIQWHIGVLNDGSPQFGYAEYICMVLREHKAADDSTFVRILDIGKVANGVDFRTASLGTISCRDETRLDDAPAARA